jgi:hypothetical protein
MFRLIALGIVLGADMSFRYLLTNKLLHVALGNIVGGVTVFMGTASSLFYVIVVLASSMVPLVSKRSLMLLIKSIFGLSCSRSCIW